MVAAAWRETDAERGEPGGDSARGIEGASPLVAMIGGRYAEADMTTQGEGRGLDGRVVSGGSGVVVSSG